MPLPEYPVTVYRSLPKGYAIDPLPPVHHGRVFHYTNARTAMAVATSRHFRASDVAVMNDPSERLFGWETIARVYSASKDRFNDRAQDVFDEIVRDALSWNFMPQGFALCASTVGDDLNQYRLYGDYQLELPSGVWQQDQERLEDPGYAQAVWRPVVYGEEASEELASRMLEAAAIVINEPEDGDATDEGVIATFMLEVAALHMKHGAYATEHEVRLIFQAGPLEGAKPKVREREGQLVTYVEAWNQEVESQPIVRGVMLGPLAGGEAARAAMRLHLKNSFPELLWRRSEDDGPDPIEVEVSKIPFRG
ncbi:hypothetical protein ACFT2C_05675 [Promicromonospora sp. NPDC057138]|uniref:hypothetical protein n=1 Tax=Promicromonospora sp. NPDC057138 TaxID=3346031 RepID=UPI00362A35F3